MVKFWGRFTGHEASSLNPLNLLNAREASSLNLSTWHLQIKSKIKRKATKIATPTLKKLRENAEAALNEGVANKEQLMNAVPALVTLQRAVAAMRFKLDETDDIIAELNKACSDYAHEHPEYVFNQSFSVSPIGVESGDIEINGTSYHFAYGFKGYRRTDSSKQITQDFLKSLPEGLAKSMLSLDTTAIAKAKLTGEDLADMGLARKVKCTWSELGV